MIIYNVTVNIHDSIVDQWLVWIKEHIPQVLATGKFSEAKLTKVLVEEQMGGQTYSIQYRAISKEALKAYYENEQNTTLLYWIYLLKILYILHHCVATTFFLFIKKY